MNDSNPPLTKWLHQWQDGDQAALNRVIKETYSRMRKIAYREFNKYQVGDTLQPTALIHETYMKLLVSNVSFENRNQFFWLMGQMMRNLLIDYIRAKLTEKRGGGKLVSLHEVEITLPTISGPLSGQQILDIDLALKRLATFDKRQSQILEMFFFCNLKIAEIGKNLNISPSTVKRDLSLAKAWLANQVSLS